MNEIEFATDSARLPESKQGVPDTLEAQHGQHDEAIRHMVSRPLRIYAIQWSTGVENTTELWIQEKRSGIRISSEVGAAVQHPGVRFGHAVGPKWASSLPSGSAQDRLSLELDCEVKSIVRSWTLLMNLHSPQAASCLHCTHTLSDPQQQALSHALCPFDVTASIAAEDARSVG